VEDKADPFIYMLEERLRELRVSFPRKIPASIVAKCANDEDVEALVEHAVKIIRADLDAVSPGAFSDERLRMEARAIIFAAMKFRATTTVAHSSSASASSSSTSRNRALSRTPGFGHGPRRAPKKKRPTPQ